MEKQEIKKGTEIWQLADDYIQSTVPLEEPVLRYVFIRGNDCIIGLRSVSDSYPNRRKEINVNLKILKEKYEKK